MKNNIEVIGSGSLRLCGVCGLHESLSFNREIEQGGWTITDGPVSTLALFIKISDI
jgi:hypothetical protein